MTVKIQFFLIQSMVSTEVLILAAKEQTLCRRLLEAQSYHTKIRCRLCKDAEKSYNQVTEIKYMVQVGNTSKSERIR